MPNRKSCGVPLLILFTVMCTQSCTQSRTHVINEGRKHNIAYLIEEGNRLWAQRTDPSMIIKARNLLTSAHNEDPTNLELSILLSRIYYFEAHYLQTDAILQDSLFYIGKTIAERGLKSALDYPVDDSTSMLQMLPKTEQTHIGLLYWWAANYGSYLIKKPVLERLEHRETFEEILHHILLLNPNYHYGGPYRLFGVFYARIPGVDVTRSGVYFDQAISAYPEYFSSKVLKAQFFLTKAGHREQFSTLLNEVIHGDPTEIPEIMPENLFEQKLAEQLLSEEALLFE